MISMTLPGDFRELGFLSRGNRMCKASKVLNVCVGGWDSLVYFNYILGHGKG